MTIAPTARATAEPMPTAAIPDTPATPVDVNKPALAAEELAALDPIAMDEVVVPKPKSELEETTYTIVPANTEENTPAPAATGNPILKAKS